MSYKTRINPVFESDKVRFLKNRPLAKRDVETALASLTADPRQGDRIPSLGSSEVRKARWALKAYDDLTNEKDVIARVKTRLRETIEALSQGPPTAPSTPAA